MRFLTKGTWHGHCFPCWYQMGGQDGTLTIKAIFVCHQTAHSTCHECEVSTSSCLQLACSQTTDDKST